VYFVICELMRRSNRLNRVSGLMAVALFVAPWLSLSSPAPLTIQPPRSLNSQTALPQSLSVFSDFDGDSKSDKAELFSSGQHKNIQISFGNSSLQSLSFDTGTTDQGKLFCRDIDGDNDEDLYWASQSSPAKFLFWISDGRGNFTFAKDFRPDLPTQIALLRDDSDPSLRQGADVQDLLCVPTSSDSYRPAQIAQQVIAHPATASISRPDEGQIFTPYKAVHYRRGPPANFS
jgi:hypothetical protein